MVGVISASAASPALFPDDRVVPMDVTNGPGDRGVVESFVSPDLVPLLCTGMRVPFSMKRVGTEYEMVTAYVVADVGESVMSLASFVDILSALEDKRPVLVTSFLSAVP